MKEIILAILMVIFVGMYFTPTYVNILYGTHESDNYFQRMIKAKQLHSEI